MGNDEGPGTGLQKHLLKPPLQGMWRDERTGISHTQGISHTEVIKNHSRKGWRKVECFGEIFGV